MPYLPDFLTRGRALVAAGVAGVTLFAVSPPSIGSAQAQPPAPPTPSVPAVAAANGKFLVIQAGPKGVTPELSEIARDTLGDAGRWYELLMLNRGVPQPDGGQLESPKQLRAGWVLRLPDDASGARVRTGLRPWHDGLMFPFVPQAAPAEATPKPKPKPGAASAAARKKAAPAKKAKPAAKKVKKAKKAKPAAKKRVVRKSKKNIRMAKRSTGPQRIGPDGLTPRTRAAMFEIKDRFGVRNIGGFCPGGCSTGHISKSDHYTGHAIDVMLLPINSRSRAMGDRIANYLVANHRRLNVKYIVWNERIWSPQRRSEGWRRYRHPSGDTTNPTLAHRDHVHLSVN